MNLSTPPKGSLEELFRHHLLESEAAAVAPRPQVWEQVDNRLLLAQNEKYRRRLQAYHWALAASLLLVSLAGGGWWRSQQAPPPPATLTQATTQSAGQPGLATARRAGTTAALAGVARSGTTAASATTTGPVSALATFNPPAIDQTATFSASAPSAAATAAATPAEYLGRGVARQLTLLAARAGTGRRRGLASSALVSADGQHDGYPARSLAAAVGSASRWAAKVASDAWRPATPLPADAPFSAIAEALPPAVATASPAAEASLATRLASLMRPMGANLPASLQEMAVATVPAEQARRWQYSLSYSTSTFQPNIDFAKPAATYNTALGATSASLTRSAAAEYRANLRVGLGQRLSLWASRRLGAGRWGLRTGLEVAQNTATSASSVAFVGEQVASLSYTQAIAAPHLQRTTYRYRSVSVPVELRYSNPIKAGFSFYGRVGAFVSALLNAHSEVEGTPEAARTYTMQSASTPYRQLSGGLRGGGGMQYRPAGHQWSLNFGPVAELGILSLNADPSQDFWGQQRPYSFGLEAGVELGRGFKIQ